eukprot:TRINITY_DN61790_c0_g1_i1.p1 TRINITY_DN61790_c0_g1~~TRINITY_DN61790_c0_g1_i1.p1  ORF type:complete len:716 (-),score=86.05 TRINITY_DN61790_c0_g1_i1:345-2492(-)
MWTGVTSTASPKNCDFSLKLGTVGSAVGPATYSKELKWGTEESTCPFQVSSQRPAPNRWKTKLVTPSPATYEIRKPADEAPPERPRTGPAGMGYQVSNSSFRATGPRFAPWLTPGSNFLPSTVLENPGPGEYSVNISSSSGQDIAGVVQPKLVCHGAAAPILGTSLSAPAIPVLRDAKDVKYTGRPGNSLGPGDYEVDSLEKPCRVMRKTAPTVDFHASETERSLYPPACSVDFGFPAASNPGAGAYNVKGRLRRGTNQPFKSRTPKIAEVVHSDTPGPGTYPQEAETISENEDGKEKLFPGMSSASSRSQPQWWRPADKTPVSDPEYLKVPGPGHYPQPVTFVREPTRRSRSTSDIMNRQFHAVHAPHIMSSLKENDGGQMSGFLSTEIKFSDKPIVKQGVSPGQYDHTEVPGQSLIADVRSREPLGKKGVFGTCNDRWHGSAFEPKDVAPAPGTYEHENVTADKRFSGPTQPGMSAFKCTVKQREDVREGLPGQSPGQYEAFDGVNYTSNFRKPATDHLSFGMGHSRWDHIQGCQDLPGPGIYDPKKMDTHRGGVTKTSQRRLHEPRIDCEIGPGQYDTRTSLIRKTFNVAGKSHARKAHGLMMWTVPVVGGGAGGGVAGSKARLKNFRRLRKASSQPAASTEKATTSPESVQMEASFADVTNLADNTNLGMSTLPSAPPAAWSATTTTTGRHTAAPVAEPPKADGASVAATS